MIGNTGRFALLAVVAFAVLGANDLGSARSLSTKSRNDADAGPAAHSEPIVMSARVGEHPGLTRFVLELSDPVTPRVFTLANPDRVVLDLPDVLWRLDMIGDLGVYPHRAFVSDHQSALLADGSFPPIPSL